MDWHLAVRLVVVTVVLVYIAGPMIEQWRKS